MPRRIFGATCIAFGLAISVTALPMSAVTAEIPPQETPPGDTADTDATVRMKERCIWYVDGVPGTINLEPAGDDVGRVYDGTEFSLEADLPDLLAWNSGNETGGGAEDPDEHAWCTYFGATSGIQVSGEWSEGGFSAATSEDVADSNLDFVPSVANPLVMALNEGICRTPSQGLSSWTVGGGFSVKEGSTPPLYQLVKQSEIGTLAGVLLEQPRGSTTDTPANSELQNDRCNIEWSVRVNIPAGGTPRYAGETYVFTGPTFTTEIVIDSGESDSGE
jgi:hypothetical protein